MLKLSEKSGEQTGTQILLDAMSNDKIHLARFILDALDGKIVNDRTERAQTPLILAVLLPDPHMRSKFMKLLLQRGADVNCQDETGRTALSYACESGHLEAVKTLVQNNADPELVDAWGNTALIYAAVAGHTPVVEFLVRAFKRLGLEIDRPNRVGNSAVQVAKHLGYRGCVLALTNNGRKTQDYENCNRHVLGTCQNNNDPSDEKFDRKFADVLQEKQRDSYACRPLQTRSGISAGETRPVGALDRNTFLGFRNRLESMDSIDEEADRESDSCPESQGLAFSNVLTPRPRLRSWSVQYVNTNHKLLEKTDNGHCSLPPLPQISDLHNSTPIKNAFSCSSTSPCAGISVSGSRTLPSPLGILLTPIAHNKGGKDKTDNEKQKLSRQQDSGIRRFNESYYQKRGSLPTCVLSPAPPDRSLLPLRKNKSAVKDAQANFPTSSNTSAAPTTFTILGNKLFRRFTFPELKKTGKDLQEDGCSDSSVNSPESGTRGMSRSETFPMSRNHPQVGSKPSIDSISAVKCEFDFQLKKCSS
ncbi:Ankyrin repeat domain-containing protein 63 [Acipenser ruthenus]|uniref:Ankyrin repeat domain-containing protein 63 n=1 Tax=Acipenser ruthenus TaxID=7906 RepID=A0A444U8C9_ACIRT|nr:ankyrin repeat domain-containing protein 36B-like [Acipenser ruthenus]RXM31411.1 Ankyrin repeat domain-containing protein 63 [Acipenser ruthenus]